MATPFAAESFLALGFETCGFTKHNRLAPEARAAKFWSLFGTSHEIIAAVWDDLRTAKQEDTRIDQYCKPIHLLLIFCWWKSYESEPELETGFNLCVNTIRKWTRLLTMKIGLFRQTKASIILSWASFPKTILTIKTDRS